MKIDRAIHQHRFILNRALVAKNNNAFQHTGKRFYLHASDLDLVSFWVCELTYTAISYRPSMTEPST